MNKAEITEKLEQLNIDAEIKELQVELNHLLLACKTADEKIMALTLIQKKLDTLKPNESILPEKEEIHRQKNIIHVETFIEKEKSLPTHANFFPDEKNHKPDVDKNSNPIERPANTRKGG